MTQITFLCPVSLIGPSLSMSRLLDGHSSAVDVRTASGTRIAIGLGWGSRGVERPPFWGKYYFFPIDPGGRPHQFVEVVLFTCLLNIDRLK